MKIIIISIIAVSLISCSTQNEWHWEKPGASNSEFNMDTGQCRAQALAGTGGVLNWGTIMIMESCLQGKGWYKVSNR